MPLFMDRHDLRDITPQDVARAHAADLEVAPKYGVEFLTYWHDTERGAAFCLARASAPEDVTAVHEEAHGLIPNEVISVSEDAVLRFLGAVRDPVDHTQVTSSFRTILFTDLEGSAAVAEQLAASAFMAFLTEHDLVIRRALVASGGREVKHTGDGIMASFEDVAKALEGALAIQEGFRASIGEGGKPRYRVRIGLAAGEPVDHNDDLFGATVILASRICDAADSGEVLVSELVHEIGSTSGFSFDAVERRTLKGFSQPVAVSRLLGRRARP